VCVHACDFVGFGKGSRGEGGGGREACVNHSKGWKLPTFRSKGHFGSFFQNTNVVTYISPM